MQYQAIDTHAHLDFSEFDSDREQLIAQLAADRIGVINVATSLESNQVVADLASRHNNIWATAGIHPTDINLALPAKAPQIINDLKRLIEKNNKIVAVGEVGLDYYREESRQLAETQKAVLRQFLTFALEVDLPVIFHCRDAYGDLLTLLADYPKLRGVIHCFSSGVEEAEQFLALGMLVSFTATVTYPGNENQRLALSKLPLEKILLETDCPFLAPQTGRGKRNDPNNVFAVADMVAQVKQTDREQVLRQTTSNAIALFRLQMESNNS